VFAVAYAYIATEKLHRLVGALGDAVLTLLLAVTNLAVNADTSSSEYGRMRAHSEAQTAFEAADKALTSGDLATYQKKTQEA